MVPCMSLSTLNYWNNSTYHYHKKIRHTNRVFSQMSAMAKYVPMQVSKCISRHLLGVFVTDQVDQVFPEKQSIQCNLPFTCTTWFMHSYPSQVDQFYTVTPGLSRNLIHIQCLILKLIHLYSFRVHMYVHTWDIQDLFIHFGHHYLLHFDL